MVWLRLLVCKTTSPELSSVGLGLRLSKSPTASPQHHGERHRGGGCWTCLGMRGPYTCQHFWYKSLHCMPSCLLGRSRLIWDSGTEISPKQAVRCWVSYAPGTRVTMAHPHKNAVLAVWRPAPSFSISRGCLFLAGRTIMPCKKDPAFHFSYDSSTVGIITFLLALLWRRWKLLFRIAQEWCAALLLLLREECNWQFLGKISHNTEVTSWHHEKPVTF